MFISVDLPEPEAPMGDPKGVILSHANLLANVRAIGKVLGASPADVMVSWLPLYHDMGLIGAWLGSLYHGCPLVLMSPTRFLERPSRWLRAIHDFGGTLSAAPNFAYEQPAAHVEGGHRRLDASLRSACAQPIQGCGVLAHVVAAHAQLGAPAF